MTVYYNGADITDEAVVDRCEHELRLMDASDSLMIGFDNSDGKWAEWKPKGGDTVRVVEEYDDTGTLTVNGVRQDKNILIISASSVAAYMPEQYRSWDEVRLKQLVELAAKETGLEAEYYDVEDHLYSYVTQDGKPDLVFANERLRLEGCAFLIHDGKMVVYSFDYLESLPVSNMLFTLDTDSARIWDNAYYGGCMVTNGTVEGKYVKDKSLPQLTHYVNMPIDSIADAERFAKNYLQYENLKRKHGVFYSDTLLSGIAPGSKAAVTGAVWTEKEVIIERVRHDLSKGSSKIWFRRCAE